jgi:xylulose-5-phosphate/fructose-6-phosphate phosphoketolase
VVRIYLPPDGNTPLSVTDHCLRSTNYVNVIVADKQDHPQFLNMEDAIEHCINGVGIWDWASNDQGSEPDVVMASCGDVPTLESLAATALLREFLPNLRIRFVNVVDLFKLASHDQHPHGLTDRDYRSIFTDDKPVIFNFTAYPWLIHLHAYKRPGHKNLHVRGYKEKGNIDTPLELAIQNQTDRYSLAIDAIDRIKGLHNAASGVKKTLLHLRLKAKQNAFEDGIDPVEIREWKWPIDKIKIANTTAGKGIDTGMELITDF